MPFKKLSTNFGFALVFGLFLPIFFFFRPPICSLISSRPKKRGVILLELLISLSLIGILLTFLFSFIVENGKVEKKMEALRSQSVKRGHLQTRLQNIFISIDRGALNPPFYTKKINKEISYSLIVQFDNGIDPDPAFSGPVTGRIYLDEMSNLSLTYWPITKEKIKPWRTEVLYPKCKHFAFDFLGPNSATEHGTNEILRPITPNLAWRTHWPKTLGTIPSMIRLTVEDQEKIEFAFILPSSELVTYEEVL